MAKVRVTAETGCWYGEKFHKPGEKNAEFQMAPSPPPHPPYPDYVEVLEYDELDEGKPHMERVEAAPKKKGSKKEAKV